MSFMWRANFWIFSALLFPVSFAGMGMAVINEFYPVTSIGFKAVIFIAIIIGTTYAFIIDRRVMKRVEMEVKND